MSISITQNSVQNSIQKIDRNIKKLINEKQNHLKKKLDLDFIKKKIFSKTIELVPHVGKVITSIVDITQLYKNYKVNF